MNDSDNQITTPTGIELRLKISLSDREIQQVQFITNSYMYIENAGKKILFLPIRNKQYQIDTEAEQSKEIDLSTQLLQVNQIKSMIGEIETKVLNDTIEGNSKIKHFHLSNSPIYPIKFKAKIDISEFEGLEQTVYQEFNIFQTKMQLFEIALKPNEVINYLESVLTINGKEQKSIVELVSITNKSDDNIEIDTYLKWIEEST